MKSKRSTFLRVLTIIFLSLTAAMTLLGGAGSTCIAFNPENFGPKWAGFIAIKPIFQILVVVSIAAALYGIFSLVRLAKNRPGAYNAVLAFLVVGLLASAVQYYYSYTLRNGSTAPNNMRLYLTGLTLVLFLLLKLPGLWQRAGFDGRPADGGSGGLAGGVSLFLTGLVTITTPLWAGPTHMVDNFNTVNVLLWPLLVGGAVLMLAGGLMLRVFLVPGEERRALRLRHVK